MEGNYDQWKLCNSMRKGYAPDILTNQEHKADQAVGNKPLTKKHGRNDRQDCRVRYLGVGTVLVVVQSEDTASRNPY